MAELFDILTSQPTVPHIDGDDTLFAFDNDVPVQILKESIATGDPGMVVGPTPPTSDSVLWADTTVEGSDLTVLSQPMPYVDVRDFGAVGDGVTDDTAELQAVLAAVAGGGRVSFPGPGFVFAISNTLTLTRTSPPNLVIVDFNGSELKWIGATTAPMMLFNGAVSSPVQKGPVIRDAIFDGSSTATAGFHWTDCGMSRFVGLTRISNVNGPAFWFRNYNAYSENILIEDVRASGCTKIAKYSAASDTGGTGTASFARQRWISMHGASLTECWVQVDSGASVYDSRIDYVKGNMGNLNVPIFDITDGTGANFIIDDMSVEQGGVSATLFDFNSTTGHGPVVNNYMLRDGIGLVTGGDITNFNKWAPMVEGITVPDGAHVELSGVSSLMHGIRELVRHESLALSAGVATPLTCCANFGAFLLCIGGTPSGNAAGVWAVAKRASGTSVTTVAALSTVNGASGETLTVTWNVGNSQPLVTSSVALTVEVTAIKA